TSVPCSKPFLEFQACLSERAALFGFHEIKNVSALATDEALKNILLSVGTEGQFFLVCRALVNRTLSAQLFAPLPDFDAVVVEYLCDGDGDFQLLEINRHAWLTVDCCCHSFPLPCCELKPRKAHPSPLEAVRLH